MKANDLWLNFLNHEHNLCGLCGNTGIIDTRGLVHSPAGVECGVCQYCICPNGRAAKERRWERSTEAARAWLERGELPCERRLS
jgi:hypothetical protein